MHIGDAEIMGFALSGLAIAVSVLIAVRQAGQVRRQSAQLETLHEVSAATRETAEELKSSTYARMRTEQFFGVSEQSDSPFECIFPAHYEEKRPLPSIASGDYYALHVIQGLLGANKVVLNPVTPGGKEVESQIRGNVVYLCSPQANPALEKIAPPVSVSNSGRDVPQPMFGDVQLPCWFANEQPTPERQIGKKLIWVLESRTRLPSPAEEEYERSSDGRETQKGIQSDYGILLRMTLPAGKAMVLAGIHQYGTWIVGDFLRRLTLKETSQYEKILLSGLDFVAVIWGEFDTAAFSVNRCGIERDYIWSLRDDRWHRADG